MPLLGAEAFRLTNGNRGWVVGPANVVTRSGRKGSDTEFTQVLASFF